MAKKPWAVVNEIIREADLILEVLDARFPEETRNSIIEGRINNLGKSFFYILNKSDLVEDKQIRKSIDLLKKRAQVIRFSAKERYGKRKLLYLINKFARKKSISVGVVGYPNVGKSSIINALKGQKSAPVSPVAGYTKGKQWIKLSGKILLIDTPGVIPVKEKAFLKLVIKDAITNIEDPEGIAIELLEELIKKDKKAIEAFYNIEVKSTAQETLEEIAKIKRKLKKGGELDLDAAGKIVIENWQRGKLKIII
ncbi:MAG: GTPase [Candidatus Nanoarchaeia archaeon]|nr:GTPase [Candidatus Nanoarchaeia archaeon]